MPISAFRTHCIIKLQKRQFYLKSSKVISIYCGASICARSSIIELFIRLYQFLALSLSVWLKKTYTDYHEMFLSWA
jgi:hypothetical protein